MSLFDLDIATVWDGTPHLGEVEYNENEESDELSKTTLTKVRMFFATQEGSLTTDGAENDDGSIGSPRITKAKIYAGGENGDRCESADPLPLDGTIGAVTIFHTSAGAIVKNNNGDIGYVDFGPITNLDDPKYWDNDGNLKIGRAHV